LNSFSQDLPSTPWISILTSWPVWALIIVEAGNDWGGFTIISDLPKYMSDVLHFSIMEVSLNSIYDFNSGFSYYIHNSTRLHRIEWFVIIYPLHCSMDHIDLIKHFGRPTYKQTIDECYCGQKNLCYYRYTL